MKMYMSIEEMNKIIDEIIEEKIKEKEELERMKEIMEEDQETRRILKLYGYDEETINILINTGKAERIIKNRENFEREKEKTYKRIEKENEALYYVAKLFTNSSKLNIVVANAILKRDFSMLHEISEPLEKINEIIDNEIFCDDC